METDDFVGETATLQLGLHVGLGLNGDAGTLLEVEVEEKDTFIDRDNIYKSMSLNKIVSLGPNSFFS